MKLTMSIYKDYDLTMVVLPKDFQDIKDPLFVNILKVEQLFTSYMGLQGLPAITP